MKSKLFERAVREAEDWPGEDEYDDFELDADEEDFGEDEDYSDDEDYFAQVTDDLTDAAGYMKNSGCAVQKGLGGIVDDVNDLFATVAKECEDDDDSFDDDETDEDDFEDEDDED